MSGESTLPNVLKNIILYWPFRVCFIENQRKYLVNSYCTYLWSYQSISRSTASSVSIIFVNTVIMKTGCGSVGRAVASDTRVPQFKSSHQRNLIMNTFTLNCWNDKNKEKRGREWSIFKQKILILKLECLILLAAAAFIVWSLHVMPISSVECFL